MPIYEYHCDGCGHDFEYLVLGGGKPDQCPPVRPKRLVDSCPPSDSSPKAAAVKP